MKNMLQALFATSLILTAFSASAEEAKSMDYKMELAQIVPSAMQLQMGKDLEQSEEEPSKKEDVKKTETPAQ